MTGYTVDLAGKDNIKTDLKLGHGRVSSGSRFRSVIGFNTITNFRNLKKKRW
jgi:hypothetical protein